jgi:hypothetical protein
MVTRIPGPGRAGRDLELGLQEHRLDEVGRAGGALAETAMADGDTHWVRADREPERAAQASPFMT